MKNRVVLNNYTIMESKNSNNQHSRSVSSGSKFGAKEISKKQSTVVRIKIAPEYPLTYIPQNPQKMRYIIWKYGNNGKNNPLIRWIEFTNSSPCTTLNHPTVPMSYVVKHRNSCRWCTADIPMLRNGGMTLRDVLDDPKKQLHDWFWYSKAPKIDIKFVAEHLHLNWNWPYISENCSVDDIEKYPNLPWHSIYITINPNIKVRDILKYRDMSDFFFEKRLSCNRGITISDILEHPDFRWDWNGISKFANISLKEMLKYSQFPWSWKDACSNPKITFEDILKYPKLFPPLIYREYFLMNPNLSCKHVIRNYLNVESLSGNSFLSNDVACKNSMITDIKNRRKKVYLKCLGSLNSVIQKYVGYV